MTTENYMLDILVVVVSLGGSALINFASVKYELRRVEPQARRKQELNNWESDTVSVLRQLWSASVRLPPGHRVDTESMELEENSGEMRIICDLISQLEALQTQAPPEVGPAILEEISDLVYVYTSSKRTTELMSHDLSEALQKKSMSAIKELANQSDRIEPRTY